MHIAAYKIIVKFDVLFKTHTLYYTTSTTKTSVNIFFAFQVFPESSVPGLTQLSSFPAALANVCPDKCAFPRRFDSFVGKMRLNLSVDAFVAGVVRFIFSLGH